MRQLCAFSDFAHFSALFMSRLILSDLRSIIDPMKPRDWVRLKTYCVLSFRIENCESHPCDCNCTSRIGLRVRIIATASFITLIVWITFVRLHAVAWARVELWVRIAATASFKAGWSKYFPKIVRYVWSFIGGRQVIQKVSNNFSTWSVEKCTYNLVNIDERLLR